MCTLPTDHHTTAMQQLVVLELRAVTSQATIERDRDLIILSYTAKFRQKLKPSGQPTSPTHSLFFVIYSVSSPLVPFQAIDLNKLTAKNISQQHNSHFWTQTKAFRSPANESTNNSATTTKQTTTTTQAHTAL